MSPSTNNPPNPQFTHRANAMRLRLFCSTLLYAPLFWGSLSVAVKTMFVRVCVIKSHTTHNVPQTTRNSSKTRLRHWDVQVDVSNVIHTSSFELYAVRSEIRGV